eukprot:5453969-Amphidinium_carterae.1
MCHLGSPGHREKRSGKVGFEFQVQQCYVTCYNTQGEKEVLLSVQQYAAHRILIYHQVHDRAVGHTSQLPVM